jgi:hypothetical protein
MNSKPPKYPIVSFKEKLLFFFTTNNLKYTYIYIYRYLERYILWNIYIYSCKLCAIDIHLWKQGQLAMRVSIITEFLHDYMLLLTHQVYFWPLTQQCGETHGVDGARLSWRRASDQPGRTVMIIKTRCVSTVFSGTHWFWQIFWHLANNRWW